MANPIVSIAVKIKDEATAGFGKLLGAVNHVKESVFSLGNLLVGLAGSAIVAGIAHLVEMFAETEVTVRRLNSALQISGRFSEEASKEIQQMAVQMQRMTSVSRQAALEVSQMVGVMARTLSPTQLAEVQKVAIALSETFGISLQRAASLIGRTLEGQFNALHRYGIELDLTTSEQQRFNQLMEKMGPLFQVTIDAAETLAGRIEQAKNQFAEIQRTIGEVIVRFLGLDERVTSVRDRLEQLNKKLRENAGEIVRFGDRVVQYIGLFISLASVVVNAVRTAGDGLQALGSIIALRATRFVDTIHNAVEDLFRFIGGKIADFIAFSPPLQAGLKLLGVNVKEFQAILRAGFNIPDFETPEQLAQVEANTNAAKESLERLTDSIKGVGAAFKDLRTPPALRVGPLAPLGAQGLPPGLQNVAGPVGEDPTTTIRRMREALATAKDEFQAGAIGADEYRRRLGLLRAEADFLAVSMDNLTREQKSQLAAIRAGVTEAGIKELIAQYGALRTEYEAGIITQEKFLSGTDAIRTQMLAIAAAAGFTAEQIAKLKSALGEAGDKRSFIDKLTDSFTDLTRPVGEAKQITRDWAAAFSQDLAAAIGQAAFAYEDFGKAVAQAVADSAKAKAAMAIADTLEALATAAIMAAKGRHDKAAEALKAAALYAKAAVAFGAVGAIAGSIAGGAGGEGGRERAGGRTREVSRERGEGTIVIEGTPLASDERFLTELNKSLEKMEGRRIRIIHVPG